METNPDNPQNIRNDHNSDSEITNDALPERNKTFTYWLAVLGALLLAVILYFALSGESDYEKGVKYLNQKQYSEALVEFQNVDPGEKEFRMAQSKINYINGLRSYNDNMYPQAKTYLS
ncbi:MAG: hypothetical protein M3P82_00115 [Bacteroidota bacterium]|nr:hypothetical protein [Bacteroidota bacterium]